MAMDLKFYIYVGSLLYLSLSTLSFYGLTILQREFREKRPYLIDQRWKRILWLASCLLFLPILISVMKALLFFFRIFYTEIRRFLAGEE